MTRRNYDSGTPFEPIVGYSRAVRVGQSVFIAGTTAVDPLTNELVGIGNAEAQARQVLENIASALNEVGASLDDVVLTRIYVTNIARDWEAVGKAHGAVFGVIRPVTAMLEVKSLINPDMLVEIEAQAIVAASG